MPLGTLSWPWPPTGHRPAVAGAGCALLAVLVWRLGPREIGALLSRTGAGLLLMTAIFALHEAERAIALGRCLPPAERPAFWRLFALQLAGEAARTMTHTGAFVSEPMRALLLSRSGVTASYGFAAAVVEFVANSAASMAVTTVVLVYLLGTGALHGPVRWSGIVLLSVSFVSLGVLAAVITNRFDAVGAALRGLERLPLVGSLAAGLVNRPADVRALDGMRLGRPRLALELSLLAGVGQILLILENWVGVRAMGLTISMQGTILMEVLTKLTNGIQVVGATEGSYSLVFEWLGLSAAVGFSLALLKRMRSAVLAGVALVLTWVVLRHRRPPDAWEAPS